MSADELIRLGEHILYEKYQFKFREGFRFDQDNIRIPNRIFTQPSGKGQIMEQDIREGIETYEQLIRSASR